jgi:hypothetical protein
MKRAESENLLESDAKNVEQAIENDLKKDFVQENPLKTKNFDKFWFHIIWVMMILLVAICVIVFEFYKHLGNR